MNQLKQLLKLFCYAGCSAYCIHLSPFPFTWKRDHWRTFTTLTFPKYKHTGQLAPEAAAVSRAVIFRMASLLAGRHDQSVLRRHPSRLQGDGVHAANDSGGLGGERSVWVHHEAEVAGHLALRAENEVFTVISLKQRKS